jgi:hypothetical protein
LPFGVGGQYLVQKTLDPVIGVIADSLLNLGLRDRLRIQLASARDVSLSLNTVDSSCIHGSSPSSGMSWFLDTNWGMTAFQGMSSADRCDFWADDNLMWLREGAATASVTVRVKPIEEPATCAYFPGDIPFQSVYYVTAPIASGDRLVVGSDLGGSMPFTIPMSYSWIVNPQLPLPRFADERYCSPVQLAPGCTADAYVPTQSERNGVLTPFASMLYDPASCVVVNGTKVCVPFLAGLIPNNRGIYGWRVRSAQGCGQ